MKLAERKLLINESPFRDVEFLEERQQRRRPHILSFEEEDRLLAAAVPHIRALAVLILETGMRSRREALSLRWNDVDFVNDLIRVRESKTIAGERTIPMSGRCKSEALALAQPRRPGFLCLCIPEHAQPSEAVQGFARKLGEHSEESRNTVFLAVRFAAYPGLKIEPGGSVADIRSTNYRARQYEHLEHLRPCCG